MEGQEQHENYIQDGIEVIRKQQYSHLVKVFPVEACRRVNPSKFYKIEIEEMNHQEDKNDSPGMDHVFRKE